VTLRKWAKRKLYGRAGAFPYFGSRVYFPKGSVAFEAACEQGIFEADNVGLLQRLCRPGTHMFDVGSNLGLMALPVLESVPDSTVVSFEPSPNSLPWLKRTIARSAMRTRWQLIEKAACSRPGNAGFSVSTPTEGLFDGLRHTDRAVEFQRVTVETTTLDLEWRRLENCAVSVIKIDVEGAELEVLRGAGDCLEKARPFVLLEWCPLNLKAYEISTDALYQFASDHGYRLYALPQMVRVLDAADLELQTMRTESFLMAPIRAQDKADWEHKRAAELTLLEIA
jgi:FkbM family methyltransferase